MADEETLKVVMFSVPETDNELLDSSFASLVYSFWWYSVAIRWLIFGLRLITFHRSYNIQTECMAWCSIFYFTVCIWHRSKVEYRATGALLKEGIKKHDILEKLAREQEVKKSCNQCEKALMKWNQLSARLAWQWNTRQHGSGAQCSFGWNQEG